jgi:hypothetical protein
MALQPCRKCNQQVSTLAVTCPHCGAPNPTLKEGSGSAANANASQHRLGPPKRSTFTKLGLGLVIALPLVLFLGVLFLTFSGVDCVPGNLVSLADTATAADSAAAAACMCKSMVNRQLSAPTFAPFRMERHPDRGPFVGRGQATALDSLGVPVTHPFICYISPSDRSGGARAYLRSRNPELYDEVVARLGSLSDSARGPATAPK